MKIIKVLFLPYNLVEKKMKKFKIVVFMFLVISLILGLFFQKSFVFKNEALLSNSTDILLESSTNELVGCKIEYEKTGEILGICVSKILTIAFKDKLSKDLQEFIVFVEKKERQDGFKVIERVEQKRIMRKSFSFIDFKTAPKTEEEILKDTKDELATNSYLVDWKTRKLMLSCEISNQNFKKNFFSAEKVSGTWVVCKDSWYSSGAEIRLLYIEPYSV